MTSQGQCSETFGWAPEMSEAAQATGDMRIMSRPCPTPPWRSEAYMSRTGEIQRHPGDQGRICHAPAKFNATLAIEDRLD